MLTMQWLGILTPAGVTLDSLSRIWWDTVHNVWLYAQLSSHLMVNGLSFENRSFLWVS